MRAFDLLPVVFAAFLAPACTVGAAGDDSTPPGEDTTEDELKNVGVTLTENDDGKTVDVVEGKLVVVKLHANPSTGYDWVVTKTDKTFGYPTTRFFPAYSHPGSGGTRRFVWETKGPFPMTGKHAVELSYKRSWETHIADKFSFTVNIQSASPGICGGIAGLPCPSGHFCQYPAGTCGKWDIAGKCLPISGVPICPMIYKPVCGCDGKTYSNACVATGAKASILHDGACP